MTRELAAGALLLLLMAGAWWNIHAVDTLTGEIMADLDASQAAEEQGNHPAAQAALDAAFQKLGKDATVLAMPYGGSTLPRIVG